MGRRAASLLVPIICRKPIRWQPPSRLISESEVKGVGVNAGKNQGHDGGCSAVYQAVFLSRLLQQMLIDKLILELDKKNPQNSRAALKVKI